MEDRERLLPGPCRVLRQERGQSSACPWKLAGLLQPVHLGPRSRAFGTGSQKAQGPRWGHAQLPHPRLEEVLARWMTCLCLSISHRTVDNLWERSEVIIPPVCSTSEASAAISTLTPQPHNSTVQELFEKAAIEMRELERKSTLLF